MSAFAKVQKSIGNLSRDEKKALALWLNSQIEPRLSNEDEERLMRSLDEAMKSIDAGEGVEIDEVRRRVSSWATK
jgi:hypothetical protein